MRGTKAALGVAPGWRYSRAVSGALSANIRAGCTSATGGGGIWPSEIPSGCVIRLAIFELRKSYHCYWYGAYNLL